MLILADLQYSHQFALDKAAYWTKRNEPERAQVWQDRAAALCKQIAELRVVAPEGLEPPRPEDSGT